MLRRKESQIRILRGVCVFLVALAVCALPILTAFSAHAATSNERVIWRKTLANVISKCYQSTYMKDNIMSDAYGGTDSVFRNEGRFVKPTNKTMTCSQVFREANVFFGKNPTLRDLGYTAVDDSNSGNAEKRCIYATYSVLGSNGTANDSEAQEYNTNQLCFKVQNGIIISDTAEMPDANIGNGLVMFTTDLYGIRITYRYNSTDNFYELYVGQQPYFTSRSWADFKLAVVDALDNIPVANIRNVSLEETPVVSIDVARKFEMVSYSEAAAQAFQYYTGDSIENIGNYKFDSDDVRYMWDKAYEDMLNYKIDDDNVGVIAKAPKSFNGATEAKAYDPAAYPYVKYDESAGVWWPLRVKDDNIKFSVVSNSYTSLTLASPSEILRIITNNSENQSVNQCITAAEKQYNDLRRLIAEERKKSNPNTAAINGWLNAANEIGEMLNSDGAGTYTNNGGLVTCTKLPDGDGGYYTPDSGSQDNPDSPNPDDLPEEAGANDLAACFSNASSLGWFICPATLLVGQATGGMYESIENDFLFFNPNMLDPDDNPGVYDAWKTIRDFANIIFAIALVVVILSQVTGIGVSNYGIKKILPSLIIVAVLVNLSFFGCQLLVDVSNILGSGLKDLFEGFKVVSDNEVSLSTIGTGIFSTLTSGAALFGAATIATSTWELWILPLLLALLVAFISMMFFYVLLAVRQALLLILIIIAPLAIVCYALPNTKKMFDRWWKIFWALLVLYPICGALMGGTKFASSLFLSMKQDSFFFNLVAVLLQVVPVFFIPTLLKGSLNALGSLGMRISNFGKRLGGNLSHAAAGTDIYKDTQRQLGSSYATRKYRSIDAGKSFMSRMSRGLHSMGLSGVAGAADSYEARRRARMINTAKKTEIEDLVSSTVHPLTDQEREAIVGEANLAELDKLAKSAESTRRMSGAADDEDGMIDEFDSLLKTLRENPDDRMAQANLIGVHNILSKSSGGRSGAMNSMANFAADMRDHNETDNAGFRFAASQMLRSAGGVYKSNMPGGFQFLSDAANGKVDFDKNNFEEDSTTGRMMMRKYTLGKLGSFSGTSLIGADDYAFESLMDVAGGIAQDQKIYNSLSPEAKNALNAQKATLDQITAAALNNPNIDGKVKDQNMLNAIRRKAGLGEIRSLYIPKQNKNGRRRKK